MLEWETEQLLALIGAALNGTHRHTDKDTDWTALLQLAARHGLQHIVAQTALQKETAVSLPPELLARMQKLCMQAVAVRTTQDFEAERLMRYFDEQGLFLVPIKGLCTRERYPDGALRSMGDLDLLYDADQTASVRAAMTALGYTDFREGRKNDTWSLPPYVHAELHRELLAAENAQYAAARAICGRLVPVAGTRCRFRMTAEDEYLFNLIHFADHIRRGGAGIRFVMDVYVYEQTPLDRARLRAELEKAGLDTFYDHIRAVAEHWFSGASPALTGPQTQLAQFILDGGVFGSEDNVAAAAVRGGRVAALARSCFPGYESMRSMFPWLERAPALLPVSWALRGFRALLRRPDHVRAVLYQTIRGDRRRARELETFFASCGL